MPIFDPKYWQVRHQDQGAPPESRLVGLANGQQERSALFRVALPACRQSASRIPWTERNRWKSADHVASGTTLAVSPDQKGPCRSEEHTSELQSLMRISYAVFC